MTIQQLDDFFMEYGYRKIPSNIPEYSCYFRVEGSYAVVCNTMRADDRFYLSSDEYMMLRTKIRELFAGKGIADVHIMTLVIAENWENVKKLCGDDPFCWMISPSGNELIVADTQAEDFYGLRDRLCRMLSMVREGTYVSVTDGETEKPQIPAALRLKNWWASLTGSQRKALPWVSFVLVLINVIIYIFCCIDGQPVYDMGSLSVGNIETDGSFYRLLTSMFLHADINHLTSNMLILFYIGEEVEKKAGHLKFTLLYFISGFIGGIFSMGVELYTGERYSSVGASGAIFGVIGGLLFLVIAGGGRIDEVTTGRIVFIIVFSLYTGFTAQGGNNTAHIGGLICGIAVMALMWVCSRGLRTSIHGRTERSGT